LHCLYARTLRAIVIKNTAACGIQLAGKVRTTVSPFRLHQPESPASSIPRITFTGQGTRNAARLPRPACLLSANHTAERPETQLLLAVSMARYL
jgi:hypothetical protein